MSRLESLPRFAPAALRLGIAVVLFWFGFSQLKSPANWTRMVPEYASSILPFSPTTLIYFNGILEVALGLLLLLGLFTRVVSGLITLHLLHITTIVGYGAVGARDLALTLASLSTFLHGADEFCLDNHIFGEKLRKSMVPANRH